MMNQLISLRFYFFVCCAFFVLTSLKQPDAIKKAMDEEFKSIHHTIITDFQTAKTKIEVLEKKYKKLDDPEFKFKILVQKLFLYSSIGDLSRLKYELNKAKRYAAIYEIPTQDLVYLEYYTALYKGVTGDFESYYQGVKSVQKKVDPKNYFLIAECKVALARYYLNKQNGSKTNRYLNEALAIANHSKDKYLIYLTSNSLGHIYFNNDQLEKSLYYFEKAKSIAVENNWKFCIQYGDVNLGEFYLFTDNKEKGKQYFDHVVDHMKETELRDLYQTYSCLEYYFNEIDNVDSAYFYATKKNDIDDQLELEQSDDLANELDKDFQSEKQKLMLDEKLAENKFLKSGFLVVIVLIVLGIAITYLFVKQKNASNKLLLKQKSEIDEKNRLIGNSLHEKENLLKEIHHRVKNNLQVVSSILNLQARNIHDKDALRIIEEGKERIFAISLVHNQLYLNKDVAFVEMGTYLEKLIHQVNTTFATHNKQITVSVEIDQVVLAIDTAVPVGLILCELLTNSYKHAFKEKDAGTIFIELHNEPSEPLNFKMRFSDDGIGYHNDCEFLEQASTGVEIISSLIQQLDARFSYIEKENGFGIFIEFATVGN